MTLYYNSQEMLVRSISFCDMASLWRNATCFFFIWDSFGVRNQPTFNRRGSDWYVELLCFYKVPNMTYAIHIINYEFQPQQRWLLEMFIMCHFLFGSLCEKQTAVEKNCQVQIRNRYGGSTCVTQCYLNAMMLKQSLPSAVLGLSQSNHMHNDLQSTL